MATHSSYLSEKLSLLVGLLPAGVLDDGGNLLLDYVGLGFGTHLARSGGNGSRSSGVANLEVKSRNARGARRSFSTVSFF